MQRISKDEFLPDLRVIEKLFDSHKVEYSDERLRNRSGEDAVNLIPRADSSEPCPFELELSHAVASLSNRVASSFRAALEMLDAQIKAEEQRVESEHEHALDNINRTYSIKSDASENAFGLNDAHKQFEKAETRFDQMYDKLGRVPVRYVPHWLYLVFAFAIFAGEIPLNALVFQIFGENQVMTWVMAFVIGLSVPLTAHFIGIKLREHGTGLSIANLLKAGSVFAVITIALYGLSLMRQTYLGEFKTELGLTDLLVERSFLFFWLNMAVFVAAIIVSYLAHDAVPGFENLAHSEKATRRAVAKEEKRRVADLVKMSQEQADALHKANQTLRDAMMHVTLLKGVYDQVLKEGQAYEQRCLDLLGLQLSMYRHENLRKRSDGASPASFKAKLDFPLQLTHMNEKLDNDASGVVKKPAEPRTNA